MDNSFEASNNIFETSKPGKGKYRKGRMWQTSPGHASNDNNNDKDTDGDAKAPVVVVDVPADVADPKGECGRSFFCVSFSFPAPPTKQH